MPRSALEAPRWKPGQEAGLEPTGWKPALSSKEREKCSLRP